MPQSFSSLSDAIAAVRGFNRFYTREVGLLRKTFLDTPWTLGEMRVLYEIRNNDGISASDISRELDLDAAYLSRLLSRLVAKRIVIRTPSETDARQQELSLSDHGQMIVNAADEHQAALTEDMLTPLSPTERRQLVDAMATIETLLGRRRASSHEADTR
ncbi:MAG: MarR family winged helix-turn-helix transcriptional regulator [Alphaproteobacteria bacterium]|nr:MarR family winged helix-turn-helix transcriptional regulator [Alphaproteobacteria bacterium]MBU2083679.1 MarR family winged helix-turn-helix transcriptional regulator [Alphaproteobacteria bacterium]MBU2143324.1 MarR family winged helix-turn-helix transcriptional regulator [Alphaproteobacteria bacterium]MBU2195145.1 MarR family winged helix-turn-helix transcriptional regulator [Alphaproteobacteria bacterium]